MSFSQPFLLPFIALAAVPILIHLLTRLRARRRPFPPIALVVRLNESTARIQKLREWLLLATRCLVVAGLVGLMAGPSLKSGSAAAADSQGRPGAIVLDNSVSMLLMRNGVSLFDRARAVAKDLAGSGSNIRRVGLMGGAERERGESRADPRATAEFIERAEPYYGRVEARDAVHEAISQLGEEGGVVHVLTDLQKATWKPARGGELRIPERVSVVLYDLTPESLPPNDSIGKVEAKFQREGAAWDLTAALELDEAGSGDALVTVGQRDGEAKRIKVERSPAGHRSVEVELGLPREAVFVSGKVALQADDFPPDDAMHYVFQIDRPVRVLVVEGEHGSVPLESETFYLSKAFLKVPQGTTPMEATILRPGLIKKESVRNTDVLILANVALGELQTGVVSAIGSAVRQGMGLIVFSGGRAREEEYNEKLGAILPAYLVGIRSVDPVPGMDVLRLGQFDWDHPLLRPFMGGAKGGPTAVKVRRYMRMRLGDRAGKVLLGLQNGDPYLVEGRSGSGTVLLFASTADREWNDLPVHTAFVPLVQEAASYLVDRSVPSGPRIVTAGEWATIRWPRPELREARSTDPAGKVSSLQWTRRDDHAEIRFFSGGPPGLYTVSSGGHEEVPAVTVAVNPAKEEMDLKRADEKGLRSWLKGDLRIRSDFGAEGAASGIAGRRDLTTLVLGLLALFVAGEFFLGNPR